MSLKTVLKALYEKVTDGYLSVTYLPESPKDAPCTRYFSADQEEAMISYIKEIGKLHNTYIGVNPRTEKLSPYQRGKRENISSVVAAYQDYDIKGLAHKETRLPATVEELYAFLNSLPIKPTFLVFTGNGVHAYWVFKIPYQIIDEASRRYIEKDEALNVKQFLTLVKRYTDVQELTAEIIREFVEKIIVYKAEKVDGHRVQRIKIIWNCIGEFNLPQQE